MSLPNWTSTQIIGQLDSGREWTGLTITYAFPSASSGMYGTNELSGFRAVDSDQQAMFRLALQNWDDLIAQSFQQTTSTGSNLEFAYSSSMSGYAHAYYPTVGSAWFSLVVGQDAGNSTTAPVVGKHGFETVMHEIGHALGLDHMGNYNAGNGQTPMPSSYQDSTVYSIMSYFGPTGPIRSAEVASADWIGSDSRSYEPQTPMLSDVMAIQAMYGASTTTRTGNTVYGFSSNITGEAGRIFDFTRNLHPILTIWDSAGTDTLDLSGWSSNSNMSLVPGVYSSANDMTNNIVIAYGAVIENAMGGAGNDLIAGNSVGNAVDGGAGNDQLLGAAGDDTITGGAGQDTLFGGSGTDTAVFSADWASYTISYDPVTFTFTIVGSATGTDFVAEVETFQFSDVSRTAGQLLWSDTVAPTLAATLPSDNAAGVAVSASLVFTFSENVQAGVGSIVIFNANGSVARSIAVTDTSQVTFSGTTVTVDPGADLAPGSSYYVNIASGVVKDLAGNGFAGISGSTAYNISTLAADSVAPALTTLAPPDNSTGVAVSANLVLSFSENVQAGTGNIVIFRADHSVALTIPVTDTAQVTFSGSTLTINPGTNLAPGTGYYVNFASGVVKDLAGNSFAGISGSTAYNFTTLASDVVAPTLSAASPSDNATGLAASTHLVLTFSENVQAGTGNVVIFNANGTVAKAISVTDTSQVTFSGNTVTIDPTADLAAGSSYYVTIASGVVKDMAGNSYAGISGTTAYNFSTQAADDYPWATDTTGVVTIDAAAATGAVNFAGDQDLFAVTLTAGKTYVFDLQKTAGGLSNPYLQLWSPGLALISYDDDSGGSLNSRIAYTATASGTYYLGVSDYASGTGGYSLSGALADTIAPTLLTTAPPDNATGVAPGANLVLTFSEAVQAGVGNLVIYGANGTVARTIAVTDTTQVSFSGNTVTIDPASDLSWGAAYYVNMASGVVNDLAGNAFGGISGTSEYNFTIEAEPATDDFPWATSTTGVVTVNGAATAGTVNFAYDADLLKVNLVAGTTYAFDLSRTTGGLADPLLQLYDPDAQYIDFDDDSAGSQNSRLVYTATATGTHYLGALDYDAGVGGYTVSASTVSDDHPWNTGTSGVVPVNGTPAAGVVDFGSDGDLFKVDLTAGTSYVFTLTRTAGGLTDPYLELFDPAVALVAYDDDSAGSGNSAITFTADSSGTYYLGVSDFDAGSGGYSLGAVAVLDDYPWDFGTEGIVVVNGPETIGTVNSLLDADLFQVELVAGVTYEFNLVRATGGLDDPYLELYGPNSVLAAFDDDSGGSGNARITYTAPSSGTYFLGALDYDLGTGLYFLSATSASADDFPWDTSTSGIVIPNGTAGTGLIEVDGDADLFQVALTGGTTYVITLTGDAGGLPDPFLQLYSPTADFIVEDDDSGEGFNASITYTAATTGTYYVGAMDYSAGTGGYSITATSTLVDDFPSNTSTTGVVAINGSTTGGVIEISGDQDMFKVTLVAGTSYAFDLVRTATGLVDPYLCLYDGSLAQLASDDDGGGSLNSRITYTAAASGTYYVGASDFDTGTGAYNLSAAVVDTTPPTLTTVSPSDDATGVMPSANLVLSFSEDIQAGTGNILLFNANGTLARTIAVTDAAQVAIAAHTVIINPAADLAAGSGYYVNLEAGVLEDLSGNSFAGISGAAAYNFTTATADDHPWSTGTTGVVAVDGASSSGLIETGGDQDLFKVALNAGTSYVFNLARTAGGLPDPYLYLFSPVVSLVATDDDGGGSQNSRITYTPASTGTYYLGASGLNSGTGGYTLSAATVDVTPPSAVTFNPADEATSVGLSSNIVLTFNEAIQRGTGTIYLKTAAGTVVESFDAATSGRLSMAGSTLTVDPTGTLAYGTAYKMEFEAGTVLDMASNPYAGTTTYNFTTVASGTDDYAGTAATTGAVAIGGSATGVIEMAGDRDWFAVTLTAGHTYRFDLVEGAVSGLSDPALVLYNGSGVQLAFDDDGGTNLNSLLNFTASSSGVYYLEAGPYGSELGSYTLSATDTTVATQPALSIAAAGAYLNEGNSGTTAFTFTVTRSGSTAGTASASWSVAGSGASPANADDFAGGVLPSGTVSFAAGQTTATVTVNVAGDTGFEADDGFTVTLSNPVGATLGTSTAGTSISDSASGGYGVTEHFYTLSGGGGTFTLDYEMYWIPDQVDIYVNSVLRATSGGQVSGGGSLSVPGSVTLNAGDIIDVVMTGTDTDTAWDYTVNYTGGVQTVNYMANGVIVNDDVQAGTSGPDILVGGLRDDTIAGLDGDDSLFGGAGDDFLSGDSGDDTLDGGSGEDTMTGGDGDDVYYVDSAADLVTETDGSSFALAAGLQVAAASLGGGIDKVVASINYTLGVFVENLTLAGAAGGVSATGNELDNILIGNADNNTLSALGGNDTLNGGAGNDAIDGGAGDDTIVFSGARSNYAVQWHVASQSFTVSSTAEGSDSAVDVESFQFADTTVSADSLKDMAAPTVSAFSPDDDAIKVAVAGNLTLTFNEAIARGIGAITLKSLEGAVLETFDAAASNRLTVAGNTVAVDPTADLAYGTGYVLDFAAGSIQDLAGNGYAGGSGYNFTTTLVNPAVPKSAYYEIAQKFYVAYFGRAADAGGLENMAQMLANSNAPTNLLDLVQVGYASNQTVRDIIDSFGLSQESSNLYGGTDTTARVTAVYNFMFNRAPDADGLAYWVGNIDSGVLSLAKAALSIMQGSENWPLDDGLTVNKKVTVAQNFTSALDTPAESSSYAGDAAAAAVRSMLAAVGRTTDTGAYETNVLGTITQLVAPHAALAVGYQYTDQSDAANVASAGVELVGVYEPGAGP